MKFEMPLGLTLLFFSYSCIRVLKKPFLNKRNYLIDKKDQLELIFNMLSSIKQHLAGFPSRNVLPPVKVWNPRAALGKFCCEMKSPQHCSFLFQYKIARVISIYIKADFPGLNTEVLYLRKFSVLGTVSWMPTKCTLFLTDPKLSGSKQ